MNCSQGFGPSCLPGVGIIFSTRNLTVFSVWFIGHAKAVARLVDGFGCESYKDRGVHDFSNTGL